MTRVRVKICGTTSLTDGLLALEAGADAVGLIFAAASKRRVSLETARDISLALGPALGRVGVFLEQDVGEMLRLADAARLSAVQVHGPRPEADWARLLAAYPVLRVLRPGDPLPSPHPHQTLLFDAAVPGSGAALDWTALAAHFPAGAWLAGGLGPDNVAQAIATLHPAGVDAVSHLERAPGLKDPTKVQAFVRAALQVRWE